MCDNYPEYLNPFAKDSRVKSKSALRNSFRELKKSLRQSFRIKKKYDEEVTIRKKSDSIDRSSTTCSNASLEALPRSRFHERVSRTPENISTLSSNPFEEDLDMESKLASTRRKQKKKAPLPPKSQSSQHINDENFELAAGGSHWSLTSVETDYSSSTVNTNRNESEIEIKRDSMVTEFVGFNEDMNKLKDDTNNNTITKEELLKTETHIPDLVITCPNDTNDISLDINRRNENKTISNDFDDNKTKSSVSVEDPDTCAKDNTSKMLTESNVHLVTFNTETINQTEEEPFLYHEKKSLYIPGSRDELNCANEIDVYTRKLSLYIEGSCDDLDARSNDELSNQHLVNEDNNDNVIPSPKQRKNKLTKNILLGM